MPTPLNAWQKRLEDHFGALAASRSDSGFPIFALEHGLDQKDFGEISNLLRGELAAGARLRLPMRGGEKRCWLAARFNPSALDAIGVAVCLWTCVGNKKMFAHLEDSNALVDLSPLGFIRRGLHGELGARGIARLGHVIWRCEFLDIDRMGEARRS